MFTIKILVVSAVLYSVHGRTLRYVKNIENATDFHIVSNNGCDCNWRYLKHYETKGCVPLEENECGCPIKFSCPEDNEIKEKIKACNYKGKEYQVGSRINVSDVCQICKCLGRYNPRVFCIPRECPPLDAPKDKDCHPVYKKDQCCPYDYHCIEEDEVINDHAFSCEYEDKRYPLHSKIYPSDDPCLICECSEKWTGINNASCYQQECILEKNKLYLDSGCIPIYHEKICCPVEFYCPEEEDLAFKIDADNISNLNDTIKSDSRCIFAGQSYEIGHELSYDHPTNCVKCKCEVPPDFTCIHQSCPSPPNSENCYSYYNPDLCCPQYECLLGDAAMPSTNGEDVTEDLDKREMEETESSETESSEGENACSDVKCDEGMKCMLYQVMCGNITCPPVPTCLKINNECSVSTCASNCVVIGQDESNCVTCACGEEINKHVSELKCQMPHCSGQNCHLVAGDGGCPVCECDQPCAVNECPPGCNVLSEAEGRCPECVCEDETEGCPTPICEDETCRIASPPGGCPTCICDNKVTESPLQDEVIQQDQQIITQQQNQVPEEGHETEGQLFDDSDESIETIQIYSGKQKDDTRQP